MANPTQQTEYDWGALRELQEFHTNASFTIGAEASNVINVAIQLKDGLTGRDCDERRACLMYLSDDANGDSIVATAPSGAVAIGADGLLHDVGGGSKKVFLLVSEPDGDIDVNITEAGARTLRMVLVLGGQLKVSGAITFT